MDFDRRIKGNLTESLVQTLLEHAGYRIVPMGVEHVIREVKERNCSSHALPLGLRTLPDFLVTDAKMQNHWQLEVKYRQRWHTATATELGNTVEEQVKHWGKLHLLLFLGVHHGSSQTPASQCRVFTLVHQDNALHYLPRKKRKPKPWRDVAWEHGNRVQDVFRGLNDTREEDGIRKCCEVIQCYSEIFLA